MAKKAIAFIEGNPDIKDFIAKFKSHEEEEKAKIDFFMRRAKSMQKEFEDKANELWKEFGQMLKDKGLIDDYVQERDRLGYNIEDNIVWFDKEGKQRPSNSGMPKELAELLSRLLT